jgi:hypothetical protein
MTFDTRSDYTIYQRDYSSSGLAASLDIQCKGCGLQGNLGINYSLALSWYGTVKSAHLYLTGDLYETMTIVTTLTGSYSYATTGSLAALLFAKLNGAIATNLGPITLVLQPKFSICFGGRCQN